MRAYLRPMCILTLAIAATSSLAQSNPAPVDNGFFRPAPDLALSPPRVPAPQQPAQPVPSPGPPVTVVVQPSPVPDAAEIARREQERKAAMWRLEEQRTLEMQQQMEVARRAANPQ